MFKDNTVLSKVCYYHLPELLLSHWYVSKVGALNQSSCFILHRNDGINCFCSILALCLVFLQHDLTCSSLSLCHDLSLSKEDAI
jgi:hypothetical protein